jgi:hypothetical protein
VLVLSCLQVIDNMDQRLRDMVATAKVFDQGKNELDFTMPVATIMAIHSHVAEGAAADAVEALATALAADTTLDISSSVEKLQKVFVSAPADHVCA